MCRYYNKDGKCRHMGAFGLKCSDTCDDKREFDGPRCLFQMPEALREAKEVQESKEYAAKLARMKEKRERREARY